MMRIQDCGGMADAPDLGSGVEKRTSSSLVSPTKMIKIHISTTLGLMAAVAGLHDIVNVDHCVVILTEITILTFAMFTLVLLWTQVRQIEELQDFYTICAWCRKIGHKGKYVPIEVWIDEEINAKTSHGICPTCHEEQIDEINKSANMW